ncbi:MAG TPA: hypothetical protein VMX97_03585 [Hyphomicrobiaceae bacterium]|nr:hypothetical protein [Hyphomicrobiaceae bacterium]
MSGAPGFVVVTTRGGERIVLNTSAIVCVQSKGTGTALMLSQHIQVGQEPSNNFLGIREDFKTFAAQLSPPAKQPDTAE